MTSLSDFEIREIAVETFKKHYKDKYGRDASVSVLVQNDFVIGAMIEFGEMVKTGKYE